jgi:LPS export ABC transporter protein LptC
MFGVRSLFGKLVLVALLAGISACNSSSSMPQKEDTSAAQEADSGLTFKDVILEQADANGQPLWRIRAKQATYSQDQKTAQVRDLAGELFQNGKSVFQVKAERGEVQQESQKIFLKGQIVATDTQDGTVLQARELEWRPEDDLLFLRKNLTVNHRQIQILAMEARASSRTRQIDAQGQVVATTYNPALRLRAEHLAWQTAEEKVLADSGKGNQTPWGVQIERSANATAGQGQAMMDRAWAGQAEVSLSTKTVNLRPNARLSLINPPLEVASQQLVWHLNHQTVNSTQPLQVLHRDQKVTVTANQGSLNLIQKRVQLTGSVQAVGQQENRSFLRTDQLTWLIPTQEIEARGNVIYHQNNPPVDLKGPRAVGKMQQQAVVIGGGRVVTEIIP